MIPVKDTSINISLENANPASVCVQVSMGALDLASELFICAGYVSVHVLCMSISSIMPNVLQMYTRPACYALFMIGKSMKEQCASYMFDSFIHEDTDRQMYKACINQACLCVKAYMGALTLGSNPMHV